MYILYTQYTYAYCNIKHTKTGYIQSIKLKENGNVFSLGLLIKIIEVIVTCVVILMVTSVVSF